MNTISTDEYEMLSGEGRGKGLGLLIELFNNSDEELGGYRSTGEMLFGAIIGALLKKEIGHLDTLSALIKEGPLEDGDIPSKDERDTLLTFKLATRIIVKGNYGYTAATYIGRDVASYFGILDQEGEEKIFDIQGIGEEEIIRIADRLLEVINSENLHESIMKATDNMSARNEALKVFRYGLALLLNK